MKDAAVMVAMMVFVLLIGVSIGISKRRTEPVALHCVLDSRGGLDCWANCRPIEAICARKRDSVLLRVYPSNQTHLPQKPAADTPETL